MSVNNKGVLLPGVRELLAKWETIKERLVAGKVSGFHTTLLDGDEEATYAHGIYEENPRAALVAILRASAARMLTEDPPLPPPD